MLTEDEVKNGAKMRDILRVLAVADVIEPHLYSSEITNWLNPIDLVISCGDLPPHYLDFLVTTLNTRLAHVIGNHCEAEHSTITGKCSPLAYPGAYNLNGRVAEFAGLLITGLEGSPVYNRGPHQYTEPQAALTLLKTVPELLINKVRTGRYLDVLVTHAPPRGVHDNTDLAHRGFESLVPFIERFKPGLLLHGHTHRYEPLQPTRSHFGDTEVINAFGHVLLEFSREDVGSPWHLKEPAGKGTGSQEKAV